VDPVPASRPRFARSGRVYYGKKYTALRRQASSLIQCAEFPVEFPLSGPLAVTSKFIVAAPKKTKRISPRGDVDNYFKTLDFFNEVVWWDDDQLVWASMTKTYGDRPGIELEVKEIDRIPETRTLSEMRIEG
jgi:Holliday junction resolvase RusA-like endonuclease